ncbi:MAG: MerR family transcriptional regulator, partial [Candidatus Omnitrophica bacterium]|nr:MerR family transcriptional regulator [Candidatus Omnitrophota bacterium]
GSEITTGYEATSNVGKTKGRKTVNKRMTITEVAEIVGISPKTIVRWEKVGKVRKAKRDWRGWRVYDEDDLESIKQFRETIVEV